MKQLSIVQYSGFLTYWNTSYDNEEHLADDKSFISSLNILFNKELFPVLLFLVQNTYHKPPKHILMLSLWK